MSGPVPVRIRERRRRGKKHVLKTVGSGTMVGRRHVLTAKHNCKLEAERLRVAIHGRKKAVKVDKVHADDVLDVAILELAEDCPEGEKTTWLPQVTAFTGNERWTAHGYPSASRKLRDHGLDPACGSCASWRPGMSVWTLAVDGYSGSWAGLSGAGVEIGGRIVAVVIEQVEAQKVLKAVPLARFWSRSWVSEALGNPDVKARHAADLEHVRTTVARLLEQKGLAFIADALGRLLLGDPSRKAEAIAEAWLDRPAREAALRLQAAVAEARAANDPFSAEELRRLWALVLPYLADLRHSILNARLALARGQRRLELDWRRESIAAAILAGACRQPCPLPGMEGVWLIPVPSTTRTAVPMTEEHLVVALQQKLYTRGLSLEDLCATIRQRADTDTRDLKRHLEAIGRMVNTEGDRVEDLDAALANRAELRELLPASEGSTPVPWLVFVTNDQDGVGIWDLACDLLGAALPSLRMALLRGHGPNEAQISQAITNTFDSFLPGKPS